MKALALLVGVAIAIVGLVGIVAPGGLLDVGRQVATPAGLWGAAALRVAVGVLLLAVAPRSRSYVGLGLVGGLFIVAGIAAAIFGADRARVWLAWLSGEQDVMRFWGVLAVALGVFIVYAVLPRRRSLRVVGAH